MDEIDPTKTNPEKRRDAEAKQGTRQSCLAPGAGSPGCLHPYTLMVDSPELENLQSQVQYLS